MDRIILIGKIAGSHCADSFEFLTGEPVSINRKLCFYRYATNGGHFVEERGSSKPENRFMRYCSKPYKVCVI